MRLDRKVVFSFFFNRILQSRRNRIVSLPSALIQISHTNEKKTETKEMKRK